MSGRASVAEVYLWTSPSDLLSDFLVNLMLFNSDSLKKFCVSSAVPFVCICLRHARLPTLCDRNICPSSGIILIFGMCDKSVKCIGFFLNPFCPLL